jgi:hypothetical protein
LDVGILTFLVELATEPVDVDLDDVRRAVPIEGPDVLAEHLSGDNLAVESHQQFENAELGRCQIDRPSVEGEPFRCQAELEGASLDLHRRFVGRSAVDRLDPGKEFVDRERLDEVVVGTGAEAGKLVGDGAEGREEDHRCFHAGIAGRTEHFETTHLGEHNIENDDVVGEERVLPDCRLAVGNPRALMAGLTDSRGDGLGDDRIVFDDSDMHGVFFPDL